MQRLLLFIAIVSSALAAPAHAQSMVSLSMGQPGFYGRIDIGNYPQPELLYPDAMMGNPGIYTGNPIYMHVPPSHARQWSRYCSMYGACNWMVYFVQPGWYNEVYVPGFHNGGYAYAPAPVYIPPPIYVPRPYYAPRPYYGHPSPPGYHPHHHGGPPDRGRHGGHGHSHGGAHGHNGGHSHGGERGHGRR